MQVTKRETKLREAMQIAREVIGDYWAIHKEDRSLALAADRLDTALIALDGEGEG